LAALSAACTLGFGVTGSLIAAPAFAYPPGQHLAVSASPVGSPTRHGQQFTVTVTNGKPGCTVRVSGGGDPVRTVIGTNGSATAVITVEADGHRRRAIITAKTEHCKGRGANESASTQVTLTPGNVHCGERGRRGRRFDIDLDGWKGHRRISVIITNGRYRYHLSDWTDDHGHVSVRFTPDRAGVWAVIAVQDSQTANVNITVD
jgi:hypothetical protein